MSALGPCILCFSLLLVGGCIPVRNDDLASGTGDDDSPAMESPVPTSEPSSPSPTSELVSPTPWDASPSPPDESPTQEDISPTLEPSPTPEPTPVTDLDGDGFGLAEDCDDSDGSIYPGALEQCDDTDHDCDGSSDPAEMNMLYPDRDLDGYGDSEEALVTCEQPEGYIASAGDCDDSSADIHPGVTEVCDEIDQDCDGKVDEGVQLTFFTDEDGDGFGDPENVVLACALPVGAVEDSEDCNDSDPTIHPATVDQGNPVAGEEGVSQAIFESIQQALDSGKYCNKIVVNSGSYVESLNLASSHNGLQLRSSAGAEQTSISSADGERALLISGIDGLHLEGFTIEADEAVSGNGGAVFIENSVDVTFQDIRVQDTETSGDFAGGGIAVASSEDVFLLDSILSNNSSSRGGGLAVMSSVVDVSSTRFEGNTSENNGGALALFELEDSSIEPRVKAEQVEVSANVAGLSGGGFSAALSGQLEIYDSYFYNNVALMQYGGAVSNPGHIERCSFVKNRAVEGGIVSGYGGALMLVQSTVVKNSIFLQNEGFYAGAVEIWDKGADGFTTFELINNTFVDNDAQGGFGDVLNLFSGDMLTLQNNVIHSVDMDEADGEGAAIFSWESSPDYTIDHNDFYVEGTAVFGGSDLDEELVQENGNLSANPLFVSYDPGDYAGADLHLTSESPCVDSANQSFGTDPDGSQADMGAYGGPRATW